MLFIRITNCIIWNSTGIYSLCPPNLTIIVLKRSISAAIRSVIFPSNFIGFGYQSKPFAQTKFRVLPSMLSWLAPDMQPIILLWVHSDLYELLPTSDYSYRVRYITQISSFCNYSIKVLIASKKFFNSHCLILCWAHPKVTYKQCMVELFTELCSSKNLVWDSPDDGTLNKVEHICLNKTDIWSLKIGIILYWDCAFMNQLKNLYFV